MCSEKDDVLEQTTTSIRLSYNKVEEDFLDCSANGPFNDIRADRVRLGGKYDFF